MTGMPTGSYIEGDSTIHRLNPFLKMVSVVVLLVAVILCDTAPGYGIMITALLILCLLSEIGWRNALGGILRVWPFFLVIFVMNTVFYGADLALWQWWIFTLSLDGIYQGAAVVTRVALAIILGNVLTATTTPMDLIGAIENGIYPLKFIGVPVKDVAMILGAAIQFVPIFIEESGMIRKAQTARGARFESKKLTEKASAIVPLVIPIFLSAFRRADELSAAMEARGYRKAKRKTRFECKTIAAVDIIFITLSVLLCAAEFII